MPDRKTSTARSIPLTYEHYLLFPEDGRRHEIIGGEHYVTASPRRAHQRLLARLHLALHEAAEEAGSGEVMLSPTDVLLSELDVVVPDLIYISNERMEISNEKNVQGPPDLVVEILSRSTRVNDERLKRDLYKRTGVLEYWIVDPELETVKVYDWSESSDRPADLLAREERARLTSDRLPALDLDLGALFEGV